MSSVFEFVVREVNTHVRVSHCQLTTALVPTVPFLCFLQQSATIAKVREIFWCLICPYPLRDRRVVVGGRWSGRPWLGPGLV